MTTSVAVFPPGFRVTDANDNPVSGATIEFYAAATTTPKTGHSDFDLLVAIGTSVSTDAGGYPTSGGNKTLVYVDTSYKVIIKDADGSVIATHDRVPGSDRQRVSSSSTAATTFGMGVGDVKISAAATPDAGFIRLTETAQSLLRRPIQTSTHGPRRRATRGARPQPISAFRRPPATPALCSLRLICRYGRHARSR